MTMSDDEAIQTIEDRGLSQLILAALAARTEVRAKDFNAETNRERFYSWLGEEAAESRVEALVSRELQGMGSLARIVSTPVRSSTLATVTAAVGGAGIGAGRLAWYAPPAPSQPRHVGPTVQRLVLGGHLRRLREQAGITTERAAVAIRGSHSKISRLENGRVGFKQRDVADLLTLYGVGLGAEREALLNLASEANTPGWWQAYADVLPHWIKPYFGLEAAAALIREYGLQFVPGLLQTEEYARSVSWLGASAAGRPEGLAGEAELAHLVEARMSRQKILGCQNPPKLWAVVDEAALRRMIGRSTRVMRAQLRHLIEMCDHPAVTLQVLPFSAGAHRAMGGSFTILRYAQPGLRDVVYLEQLTSALYLDKRREVDSYLEVMEEVCLKAETPAETPGVLAAILREL